MNQNNNGVFGNSIDIKVDPCNTAVEIRADVKVEEYLSKRIWGQIVNCDGMPIGNTLIKLVKIVQKGNSCEYIGMAHTVTDCEGFYQFDVCANEVGSYKIIVNKAVVGDEMVMETNGGNCNGCSQCGNSQYDPCVMPNRYVVEERHIGNCQTQHPAPAPNCQYQQVFCVDAQPCHKPRKNYATYTR